MTQTKDKETENKEIEIMDETLMTPVGLLWNIFSLSLPLAARQAFMDTISNLPAKQRLFLEIINIQDPDALERATKEALRHRGDLTSGDTRALWDRFVVNMVRRNIMKSMLDRRNMNIKPENPLEYKRYKDTQKARMLQQGIRSGKSMERDVHQTVFSLIDHGYSMGLGFGRLGEGGIDQSESGSGPYSDIIKAYEYLLEDQNMLMNDIVMVMKDEDVKHSDDVAEVLFTLGVEDDANVADSLLESNNKIKMGLDNIGESVLTRLRQYRIFETIRASFSQNKLIHLTDMFMESMKVLFESLGALGVIHLGSQELDNDQKFQLAARSTVKLADELDAVSDDIASIRQVVKSADDLASLTEAADNGSALDLDIDGWEKAKDDLQEKIQHVVKNYKADKKKIPVGELTEKITKEIDLIVDGLRLKKIEDKDELGVFARVLTVANEFKKSLGSIFIKDKKEDEYYIEAAALRGLVDQTNGAQDNWREGMQTAAEGLIVDLGKVFREDAIADDQVDLTLGSLAGTLALMLEVDSGWEDELRLGLLEYRGLGQATDRLPKKIRDGMVVLQDKYAAKPLSLIFEEVENRWDSEYPFYIYPFEERQRAYNSITRVFNLLLKLLSEQASTFKLPEGVEKTQEVVPLVTNLLAGLDPLYRVIMPRLRMGLYRAFEMQEYLARQGGDIADMDRTACRAFSGGNLRILDKAVGSGGLDMDEEKMAEMIDMVFEDYKHQQSSAATLVSTMMVSNL